jgi:transglutaminase-like putative cysteine protease
MGMPARVSVGYLTEPGPDAGEEVAEGRITSRQADVWPEVFFEGAGWVAFDPTPPRVPTPPPPKPPDQPQVAGGGFVDALQPPAEIGPSDGLADTDDDGISARILVLVVLILLLVGLPLVPLWLKAHRRRRRQRMARTTSQRVLSIWADVVDRLLEIGVPLQRSMTAREVAGRSIEYVSPEASARLYAMAPIVTAAVFAPTEPDEDRALQMRALADAFAADVAANRKVSARVAAALSPRPLLYARR